MFHPVGDVKCIRAVEVLYRRRRREGFFSPGDFRRSSWWWRLSAANFRAVASPVPAPAPDFRLSGQQWEAHALLGRGALPQAAPMRLSRSRGSAPMECAGRSGLVPPIRGTVVTGQAKYRSRSRNQTPRRCTCRYSGRGIHRTDRMGIIVPSRGPRSAEPSQEARALSRIPVQFDQDRR